ncbi:WXG100 family type VII secretion target [Streptomyces sp. NPDC002677]|uniref:WXG100 family type VII secretion target n=1 Tax=Streptomyces sp. NPDC002677 TaxID=3154774 RepID=UPI003316FB0C
MASTQVDIQGMITARGAFQDALEHTTGAYSQMDGQISGLLGSWQGDASNIFHQAMQEWLADFGKVNTALQKMLDQLVANTSLYDNVHNTTTDSATSVRNAVGNGLPNFKI